MEVYFDEKQEKLFHQANREDDKWQIISHNLIAGYGISHPAFFVFLRIPINIIKKPINMDNPVSQ